MAPDPLSPFRLIHSATSAVLAAGAVVSWDAVPGFVALACAAVGILGLVRVSRRLRSCEVALAFVILAAYGGGLDWLAFAGLSLAACGLAPESRLLRLNGMDRFMVAQDYDGMRVNSHVFLDTDRPLGRSLLEEACADLVEIPLARSFLRASWWGVERFEARRPWFQGADRLLWLDHEVERLEERVLDRILDAPFDLEREPPWRVLVIRRDEGGWRLVFTMHHSVGDGTATAILFDCLMRRYEERRAGLPQEPFRPELMRPHPRMREVLRPQGLRWMWRMIRRHVHPMTKLGVKNASILEEENVPAEGTFHELLTLPGSVLESLKEPAQAAGCTRNHILLAASLRAAAAWRAARDKPRRPFRVMLPSDLRSTLGLPNLMGNYVGILPSEFTPEEVDGPDILKIVGDRVRFGRTLEEAIEAPINLGLLSSLLPTWVFRDILRRFDTDPETFFFSYLWSAIKPFPDLVLPRKVTIERLWLRTAMQAHPGFGLVLVRDRGELHVVVQYRRPLITPEGVRDYLDRYREELERLVHSGARP